MGNPAGAPRALKESPFPWESRMTPIDVADPFYGAHLTVGTLSGRLSIFSDADTSIATGTAYHSANSNITGDKC